MTELEKYREEMSGPTADTFFYGLRDPRQPDAIPNRCSAKRHPGQVGWVGAFHPTEKTLTKVLYKRLETFKRQFQVCSASRCNWWLRNLMDHGGTPEVRLLFFAPAYLLSAVTYTCERLMEGAVYDAKVLQPITDEDRLTQRQVEAQQYTNKFFAKWHSFREAHPQVHDWDTPASIYEQVPRDTLVAPAHRLTVKSLQEQIEKLAARIELLEKRPTV